jgi:phosphate transport system protein
MLQNFNEKIKDTEQQIKELLSGLLEANDIIRIAMSDCDKEKFAEAKTYIKNVGIKVDSIDNEIVTLLALHQPEAKDLRRVISYLKITNEILRASSSTRSFIKGFQDVCAKLDLNTINQFAIPMQDSTVKALKVVLEMIDTKDHDEMQENYNTVLVCENKTDDLYDMIETRLLKQADKKVEFKNYHMMLASLRRSEKVADRAMSIATLLLYAIHGGELQQN